MQDTEWQKKIDRSRIVETHILKWFQKNIDQSSSLPIRHCSEYDIICPAVGNIEIKEDLIANTSGNYAIEFQDFQEEPSGIDKTTAELFILVDKAKVVMIATESLRYLIRTMKTKRTVNMGYKTLEGRRAKGYLIPRDALLNSFYATVLGRWF